LKTGQMREIEVNGKAIEVSSRMDAIGLFCPIPIVKLKTALQRLGPKEVIEILADDPGFPDDVIAWCKETCHRLLSLTQDGEGIFTAYVENP